MVRIPPPIWGLIFIGLAGVVSSQYEWKAIANPTNVPIGAFFVIFGLLILFWATGLFIRAGTQINPTSPTNNALVTNGIFGLTRNPMYLAFVTIGFGIALWVGSLPMFVPPFLVFAIANWVHIPFEEEKMRRQFGAAFDAYVAHTPRWL
jgi:protein-S-isoprenylcysteine O-methyltransferase Ste14